MCNDMKIIALYFVINTILVNEAQISTLISAKQSKPDIIVYIGVEPCCDLVDRKDKVTLKLEN